MGTNWYRIVKKIEVIKLELMQKKKKPKQKKTHGHNNNNKIEVKAHISTTAFAHQKLEMGLKAGNKH